MFTIDEFHEEGRCDNCDKETEVFAVRCSAGTLDARFCAKCLAKQCRLRAKSKVGFAASPARRESGEKA